MTAIKFDMGQLDASSVTEQDLNPPQRLKEAGAFEFVITNVEVNPKKKDGTNQANLTGVNGSVFAPAKLTLETNVDGQAYTIEHRIFVPIEGPLKYQKEGGKETMVFTAQVRKLIEAIKGIKLNSTGELIDALKDIGNILSDNPTCWGYVGEKSGDKIQRISDTEYNVMLADGELLTNDLGEVATADSYKGMAESYSEILGRPYQAGVELKNFFIPKSDNA